MASADIWDLKIRKAARAMPHHAVDPTVTATVVISTLQTVVSREIDPQETVVLSIGKLEAGTAVNIIPTLRGWRKRPYGLEPRYARCRVL